LPRGVKNTIESVIARLVKPNGEDGCWIWLGAHTPNGYGLVTINGGVKVVHVIVYEHFKGGKPPNTDLHHTCSNKACANPDHVVISNYKHRAFHNSQRTHCIHGHEFTPENTMIRIVDGYTRRICKTCKKEIDSNNYQIQKNASRL
jgi:hypothetical protein